MAYKIEEDPNYWNWLETANRNPIPDDQVADFELALQAEIKEQLDYLRSMEVNEYALFHKYHELQDWIPRRDIDVVHEVRDLIGYSTEFGRLVHLKLDTESTAN